MLGHFKGNNKLAFNLQKNKVIVFAVSIILISIVILMLKSNGIKNFVQNIGMAFLIFIFGGLYFGGVLRLFYKFFNYKIFRYFVNAALGTWIVAAIFIDYMIVITDDISDLFIGLGGSLGIFFGMHITRKWAYKKLNITNASTAED